MMILLSLLLATTPAPDLAAARLARAVDLYEAACLKTFPDDAAIDGLMTQRGAKPLTAEQVKVTLRDDPGRGWQIGDGAERMLVFLELPPFHACSVRFDMPNTGYDLSGYEAAATRFTADHEGFSAMPPFDQRVGTMRIHAEGRQRVTADRGESLFVIAQQNAANAKTDLRFVHQIGAPPGK